MGALCVTSPRRVLTHSEEDTATLGRELAATLSAGDVLLLYGDLGAGKTAFVRGLAEGLGVDRGEVSSPTFTLIQEYRGGRLTLFHVDLYRIEDPREFDELGLDEIAEDGVLAIEWADKYPRPPSRAVRVSIAHAGESQRRITVESNVTPTDSSALPS
jgi:tRNA threonylcarbamoyladenosine biosynthesis protein TsaE